MALSPNPGLTSAGPFGVGARWRCWQGQGPGTGCVSSPLILSIPGFDGVVASVEEDGDAVGDEGAGVVDGAGADDGLGVVAGAEVGFEGSGETAEIGTGVAHDEERPVGAGEAHVGGAGLAGVGGGGEDGDAEGGQQGGDGGLLLGEGEVLDGALEVFDGEELVALGDDSDADGVDGGVEEVAAVAGGVHPGVLNLEGGGAFGDVFGDDAEAGTDGGGALGEFKFSWILMGYVVVGKHDAGMNGGGADQGGIAAEWGESEGGTLLVGGGLEVLLGDGGRAHGGGLRGGRKSGEKQKCGGTHGSLDPNWVGKMWQNRDQGSEGKDERALG
jgi:hypothetical protein